MGYCPDSLLTIPNPLMFLHRIHFYFDKIFEMGIFIEKFVREIDTNAIMSDQEKNYCVLLVLLRVV